MPENIYDGLDADQRDLYMLGQDTSTDPNAGMEEDQLALYNSKSTPAKKDTLLPGQKALQEKYSQVTTDPTLPVWQKEFIKNTAPSAIAAAGIAEEIGMGIQFAAGNLIGNSQSIAIKSTDSILNMLAGDKEPREVVASMSAMQTEPGVLDNINLVKEYVHNNVDEDIVKRIDKYENVFGVAAASAAALLPISKAGKAVGTIGRFLESTKLGFMSGLSFEAVHAFFNTDQDLSAQELGTRSAVGGVSGATFAAGTHLVIGGVGGTYNFAKLIKNYSSKNNDSIPIASVSKDEAIALAELTAADPTSKRLYKGFKSIGYRPTHQDIQPANEVATDIVRRAAPFTAAEKEIVRKIDLSNQKVLNDLYQTKVADKIDDITKNTYPNVLAEEALNRHVNTAAKSIRHAANHHPEVANVYQKIDAAVPLDNSTSLLLNNAKTTVPGHVKLVNKWNLMRSYLEGGRELPEAAKNIPGINTAVATYNKVGSVNTTSMLDLNRKLLNQELRSYTPGTIEHIETKSALKMVDHLLERHVPGYTNAVKQLDDLSMFPEIAKNPVLKDFLTANGKKSGQNLIKTIFNPKTSSAERKELVKFFNDGIRNIAGELVIPGNRVMLAAATKARMEQALSKVPDTTNNFTQRFVKAFQSNPSLRQMYNDILPAVSGKVGTNWTKAARLIDASFEKYGKNIFNGGAGSSLESAASASGRPGTIAAEIIKATQMVKRRALFNFMYLQNWDDALQQAYKYTSFQGQVSAVSGWLLGAGATELFDFSDDVNITEYIKQRREVKNKQNSKGNSTVETMRSRGF